MEVTTIASLPFRTKSSLIKVHCQAEEKGISPLHIENIATTISEEAEPPSSNQLPTSPILNLPRELRDIILTHIVDISLPHLNPNKSPLPSILRVNRQLRDEFAQIFYSEKLILAGGAPSPKYEKNFFIGFDPQHKEYVRRVHWLYDSYGTEEQAVARARELDGLSGMKEGVWTVRFIDPFMRNTDGRARYVNAFGVYKKAGEV